MTENPPTSDIASEHPANTSGCSAAIHREPKVIPASSSAKKARTISRGGLYPVRAHFRTMARIIASIFFISTAPRPQITPSRISAANGSTDQSSAFAGTTSICPCTTNPGRVASLPGSRAITLQRFGADSNISDAIPTSASEETMYSATAFSSPLPSPKLTEGIRIKSWQIFTTSASRFIGQFCL